MKTRLQLKFTYTHLKSRNSVQWMCWKSRDEAIDEIDRKVWARKRNLGPGSGPSGDWTLCDIGPENAYLNLTRKAVRKIDENDIKGFWTEACSPLTDEALEYIFKNIESFLDLFVKGVLLRYSKSEKYSIKYIERHLKTINKSLKKRLKRMQQTATDNVYIGYMSLSKMIAQLEKDFIGIENPNAYYKFILQRDLINELEFMLEGIET